MRREPCQRVVGKSRIIFDPGLVDEPSSEMFTPDYFQGLGGVTPAGEGRGSNFFVRIQGRHWVLRHYRRGGLAGKVLHDRYLNCPLERSRSWREWSLLDLLHREGFPVPRPVAAHVRAGMVSYRADLITEELQGVSPLSRVLAAGGLDPESWRSVGRCLKRFHRRGVCHADLNAHNIMLGEEGRVYLLDFDRGEIRSPGRWQERNLMRLHRSLRKLKSGSPRFAFDLSAWRSLLGGYHEAGDSVSQPLSGEGTMSR